MNNAPPSSEDVACVAGHMEDGETLRWIGCSDPGDEQRPLYSVHFLFLIIGLSLEWTWLATGHATYAFLGLFPLVPPMLAPLDLLRRTIHPRTIFVVTDRRAMVIYYGSDRWTETILPKDLLGVSRTPEDHSTLSDLYVMTRKGPGFHEVRFLSIPNAREVEVLIRLMAGVEYEESRLDAALEMGRLSLLAPSKPAANV